MSEESETAERREYFYEDDDPFRSTTVPRSKVMIFYMSVRKMWWKRCRNCGAFLYDPTFRYCPYCGILLEGEYVFYWRANE